jgi:hypothetical protein
VALAPGQHLVQVLTPEHGPFVANVTLDADQHATLDTGIALPRDDDRAGKAILATSAVASLAAGAVFGALAWRSHGTYSAAYDACTDASRSAPCAQGTRELILDEQGHRDTYAIVAGASGALGLGLGATLLIRW